MRVELEGAIEDNILRGFASEQVRENEASCLYFGPNRVELRWRKKSKSEVKQKKFGIESENEGEFVKESENRTLGDDMYVF